MRRKRPFEQCERRYLPTRLRAEIMLRQDGRCADCGTRLILGFFVFDHRPPLALRDSTEDANDPDRLAAICWNCNELKTPQDLKEIAKSKRIAAKHQAFLDRQREKQPGRRVPTPAQGRAVTRTLAGWAQSGEAAPRPKPTPPAEPSMPHCSPTCARPPHTPTVTGSQAGAPETPPRLPRPGGLPPLLSKPKT